MLIALVAILAFLLVLFLIVNIMHALVGLVFLLLVAALCGTIAESLLHYRQGGIAATTGVGLVGGVLGIILAKILHLPTWPHFGPFPVVWTVIGSLVLVSGLKVAAPHKRLHGRRDIARW